MKDWVSKLRTRQTRQRERRSGLVAAATAPFGENPILAFLIALVLLVVSLALIRLEDFFNPAFNRHNVIPIAGDGILLAAGMLAAAVLLRVQRPHLLYRNSAVSLLALISLLPLVTGSLILHATRGGSDLSSHVAVFFLPFAMAPLMATILLDSTAGIIVGAWSSLTLAMAAGGDLVIFLTGIVATTVTALLGGRVRKRLQVFESSAVVGIAQMLCVLGLSMINWAKSSPTLALNQASACLGGAFLSAIVVVLILPVFEVVFRITTDIRLLELSDLGHDLLQRLAMEAPGTYHHSLVVANLAQAAADEIGANSLLARVASYFHDIGKLTKPDFFTENIMHRENPHDDLPPSMSTLVITAHVKEGLSLAMLHKLPTPIMQAISEHHGTSLISYFHHKAKTQMEQELSQQERNQTNGHIKINEADFRYSGPKPSSKEIAIVSLADAVEAASRSMERVKPGQIDSLVNDIMDAKIQDGQLDDCDLAMSDLAMIRRSFIFTLTTMLHGRIPYPKDEDRDKQPPRPQPG